MDYTSVVLLIRKKNPLVVIEYIKVVFVMCSHKKQSMNQEKTFKLEVITSVEVEAEVDECVKCRSLRRTKH